MNKSRGREPSANGHRLWIINHYANAPDQPTGTRHYDLARYLAARGHAVVIFASSFNGATGKEGRLSWGALFKVQWFDGVQFVWLRTLPYSGNSWRRSINMLSYVMALLVVQTRFSPPDTIIGSTVHPFAAFAAWLVARRHRATFLFEVRDLWPQTLVDLGALRSGSIVERVLRAIEAILVRHATVVITLLPGMVNYLRERGLPSDHVVYLPNGVDLRAFDATRAHASATSAPLVDALNTIERMGAEGRIVFGYVGSFGRVNELSVVVRAAAIAERLAPGCCGTVLIGDGPERPMLEQLAGESSFVAICDPVAREAVPTVLRALDATIVHTTMTPVYRYGISFNKLFEYMAAARPIVFACSSAYDPVTIAKAGISVMPDDPELLADALLEVANASPEARAAMGAAGRAYVEKQHDIEHLGAVLEAVLNGARPKT